MNIYLKREFHAIFQAGKAVKNELEARDKAQPNAFPLRHDWRETIKLARVDNDTIDATKVAVLASFAAGVRDPLPMHVLRRKFGAGERLAHMIGAEAQDRSPVPAALLALCDAATAAHAAAIARRRAHHTRTTLREPGAAA